MTWIACELAKRVVQGLPSLLLTRYRGHGVWGVSGRVLLARPWCPHHSLPHLIVRLESTRFFVQVTSDNTMEDQVNCLIATQAGQGRAGCVRREAKWRSQWFGRGVVWRGVVWCGVVWYDREVWSLSGPSYLIPSPGHQRYTPPACRRNT